MARSYSLLSDEAAEEAQKNATRGSDRKKLGLQPLRASSINPDHPIERHFFQIPQSTQSSLSI